MNLRAASLPLLFALLVPLALTGCHSHTAPANTPQARAEQRAELATEREQLDLIPPPVKSRYMAIRSLDSWQNPYLVVQAGMLELHVTLADANPSPIGAGGMLRPIGARRQELNIDFDKLADAMSAIPPTSWPYGRVIAIQVARNTPPSAEPNLRRHLETAVATLNNLGIEAYDLNQGSLR